MTNPRCAFALAILLTSLNAFAGPAKDETLRDGSQITRVSGTVSVTCISGCSGGTGGGGTLGQQIMASSSPVVIASNQSAFPVNAAQSGIWNTRLFDNGGVGITSQTSGTQRAMDVGIDVAGIQVDPRARTWTLSSGTDSIAAIESGTWSITNISGTVSLPTGASTSANQTLANTKLDTLHTDLTSIQPRTARLTDGTNAITKTFDNDTGAGTEYNIGVSLRKSASGGSVELGTSTDPVRTDPTGTTTQPISVASLPLPSGAATDASLTNGTQKTALVAGTASIGTVGLNAGTSVIGHVIVDTAPTTAVTGPVTDAQMRASAIPVSLASLPALATGSAVIGHVIVDTAPSTAVTNAGTFAVQDTPPTLTKGTQGATGYSVQELKDAGRTAVSLYVESAAGAASEALLTLNQSKGFAAATTGTSYTVTTGKTLRLTAICAALVSTTTTANTARIRVRVNTAGAAALTSPIAFSMIYGWPTATFIANEAQTVCHQLPDGTDIPAASGVGVTHLEAAANGAVSVQLNGFEY